MTLSPAFLDDLRARTTLSALIGKNVKLQKAGREWKACCPFHNEKTPSFTINDEKGFFHCFGCGAHGDAIRWLTDSRGLQFIDAVKELADAAGIQMPAPDPDAQRKQERANTIYEVLDAAQEWFRDQLNGIEGAAARAYLAKRGIRQDTIEQFGFGFAPDSRGKLKDALRHLGSPILVEAGLLIAPEESNKEPFDRFRGRLMLPIRDQRGRIVAFAGRTLGSAEPKYLNSPETPVFDKGRILFNLHQAGPASREANRVILVEGYMDVIALAQAGVREVVAPMGTALTETQLQKLWHLSDHPILCFDGDAAGKKAAIRATGRALPVLTPGKSILIASLPQGQDPDDLVAEGGKARFEEIIADAATLSDFVWKTECEAEPLETPEARAALGRRLRERAREIADNDVRVQYLAYFNGQLSELFERFKKDSRGAARHAFLRSHGLSPEILAINEHGIDQAVMVRAILAGLRRHPVVIGEFGEAIGLMWIKHKQWARIREAMLVAALEAHPLSTRDLEARLLAEGLAPSLDSLRKPRDLAFSFLRDDSDDAVAQRDLAEVLDKITEGASFEAAIREAYRRVGAATSTEWNEAFAELERLYSLKRASDESLRELAWTGERAPAEA